MAVTITSVAPGYGQSGDHVTINGTGFVNAPSKTLVYRRTDNGAAWVNVAAANVAYVSAVQLTVTLATGDSWEPGLNDIGVAVYAATPPAAPEAWLADALYFYVAATVAITAAIAGASSNSYVTAVEADGYFAERLNATAWTDATTDQKAQALIMACRAIGRLRIRCHRPSQGPTDEYAVYDDRQALPFPRAGDFDTAGAICIPTPVKHAQLEEALAILAWGDDAARRSSLQHQGVASFNMPGRSESFTQGARGSVLASTEAYELIRPYLDSTAVLATSPLPQGEFSPGSSG